MAAWRAPTPGRSSARSTGTPPQPISNPCSTGWVCMNGGNPRPDLIDKKDTLKAQALERSPLWKEISKNHLSGRTAAFFCYGDDGGNEEDGHGMPKKLEHPEWFDASQHPMRGKDDRRAYQ